MILLFFILFSAVCFDLKTFRIPNRLIWIGYGGGIFYHIFRPGEFIIFEFIESMLCAFLLLILLLPLFKIRAIGGGDVKLFSVCGLFTGFTGVISIILYAFFIGALISILSILYSACCQHFSHGRRQTLFQEKKNNHIIHFSIPILLGTVAHCLLGGAIWQL